MAFRERAIFPERRDLREISTEAVLLHKIIERLEQCGAVGARRRNGVAAGCGDHPMTPAVLGRLVWQRMCVEPGDHGSHQSSHSHRGTWCLAKIRIERVEERLAKLNTSLACPVIDVIAEGRPNSRGEQEQGGPCERIASMDEQPKRCQHASIRWLCEHALHCVWIRVANPECVQRVFDRSAKRPIVVAAHEHENLFGQDTALIQTLNQSGDALRFRRFAIERQQRHVARWRSIGRRKPWSSRGSAKIAVNHVRGPLYDAGATPLRDGERIVRAARIVIRKPADALGSGTTKRIDRLIVVAGADDRAASLGN